MLVGLVVIAYQLVFCRLLVDFSLLDGSDTFESNFNNLLKQGNSGCMLYLMGLTGRNSQECVFLYMQYWVCMCDSVRLRLFL